MTLHAAIAAAATLVALAFALSTWERWLARRRRHELAWSVSLAMFALGAAALWAGASLGWAPWSFRAFYLFGAILNVPFLALGTVYLLGGPKRGDRWGAGIALLGAFATGVLVTTPLAPLGDEVLPQGSEVFGLLPRVLAAACSGLGATVVLGGAVMSAWRLLHGRRRSAAADATGAVGPHRLAAANLTIAAGTLVLSAGGLLNSVVDEMTGFAITLLVGVVLLFTGFLLASSGPTGTSALRSVPDGVVRAALEAAWRDEQRDAG